MLIGQTVFVPAAGAPGTVLYGPWMPRGGNAFAAVLELMRASATTGWSFKVDIETKNAEDSDAAPTNLGAITQTTAGTYAGTFTGCLELVRYKYLITGGGTDRWIHFRMNPPVWQTN